LVAISIIVPVSQNSRSSDLESLFRSLSVQSWKDFEVLVVGSKSQLPVKNGIQYTSIPTDERVGATAARNLAASESNGRVLGFVDDDVILDSRWCEHAVRTFRNPSIGGASGMSLVDLAKYNAEYIPRSLLWVVGGCYWNAARPTPVFSAAGMNFCVRKDVFFSSGMFDESLGPRGQRPEQSQSWKLVGAEESDLALRIIRNRGMTVVFNPLMQVRHRLRREAIMPLGIAKRSVWVGHNRAYIHSQYGTVSETLDQSVLRDTLLDIMGAIGGIISSPLRTWKSLSITMLIVGAFGLGYSAGKFRFAHRGPRRVQSKVRLVPPSVPAKQV
jgi:glycosyltransferase involved in cell wall biosynthesis